MTALPLFLVRPADVDAVWAEMSDHIGHLAARCDEGWSVDHVRRAIDEGEAKLWRTPDGAGFIVTTVQVSAWSRAFHVWIASNRTVADAADYVPQLKTLAAAHNCGAVVFESPRRWERALPEAAVRYLYTIKLGDAS